MIVIIKWSRYHNWQLSIRTTFPITHDDGENYFSHDCFCLYLYSCVLYLVTCIVLCPLRVCTFKSLRIYHHHHNCFSEYFCPHAQTRRGGSRLVFFGQEAKKRGMAIPEGSILLKIAMHIPSVFCEERVKSAVFARWENTSPKNMTPAGKNQPNTNPIRGAKTRGMMCWVIFIDRTILYI